MNAAARLVHQHVLARHLALTHALNRRQTALLLFAIATLFSALGIIYITHTNRLLYASYQHNITENARLQVLRSQLLLERSTMMVQSRTEKAAAHQGMYIPSNKDVVTIHE